MVSLELQVFLIKEMRCLESLSWGAEGIVMSIIPVPGSAKSDPLREVHGASMWLIDEVALC